MGSGSFGSTALGWSTIGSKQKWPGKLIHAPTISSSLHKTVTPMRENKEYTQSTCHTCISVSSTQFSYWQFWEDVQRLRNMLLFFCTFTHTHMHAHTRTHAHTHTHTHTAHGHHHPRRVLCTLPQHDLHYTKHM